MRGVIAATITTLVGVALLVGLGVWQLERREWKTKLIADLAQKAENPPFAWDSNTLPPPEFSHVTITGDLRTDKPLLLYGRTLNGVAGVHELAVLMPENGVPVLVDEGFVPLPISSDEARQDQMHNRQVEGLVRNSTGKAWFDADNDPARNEWFWIDLPRMAHVLGIRQLAPVYLEATVPVETDGPTPTGNQLAGNIRNEHLTYAITWFSLAGVLVVIYGVWLARRPKPE